MEDKKMKRKKIVIIAGIIIAVCVIGFVLMITAFSSSGFHETKIRLDNIYSYISTSKNVKVTKDVKEHVSIIPEYTTEISTGYLNSDGTKTLDVYACPIAYKDKNGQLSMIDTRIANVTDDTLKKDGFVYTIANSDIKPYFPKELTKNSGILISKNFSYEFGVINDAGTYADYKNESNFIGESKKMIIYKNAFGNNTELRSYPTVLGSNCEIILNKKPTDNKLSLWLKIIDNSVNVSVDQGGYILMTKDITDSKGNTTKEILGVIQSPLVKDSSTQKSDNSHFSYRNSLQITDQGNGKYLLTMTIDNSMLDSLGTKYPVSVFSSFELFRDKEPDSAIYSGKPDLNSYLGSYTVLGNSDDYGVGRIFIRYLFTKAFKLQSNQIIQVDYYTYNLSNNNKPDNLEMMSVLEDWCSLTRKWSESMKVGDRTSFLKMTQNELKFDITKEVKKWCDDPNPAGILEHQGVELKSANEKEDVWNVLVTNDTSLYNVKTEIILK
jgi:hypothetical protein